MLDRAGIQIVYAGGHGLLRRRAHPSRRSAGRPRRHAPQYRCVVAYDRGRRAWRPSSPPRRPAVSRSRSMGMRCPATPSMREKAARISALARDLSELLPRARARAARQAALRPASRLAFHPPCTLQHGQRIETAASRRICARWDSMSSVAGSESHCAAAPRALTHYCNRRSPANCATASSSNLAEARTAMHRVGQHGLHSAPAVGHADTGQALGRGVGRALAADSGA